MKITKIECIPITVPYTRARQIRGQPVPGSQNVLVKVHTDEGITGIGETGACAISYTGDSAESIIGFVAAVAPKLLIGQDPLNIEKLVAGMDAGAKYSNQAMAVIDCCLHDIAGKKLGVPVYQLLGGLSNATIELSWVLGYGTFLTPEDVAERSAQLLAAGYRAIKLKVGRGTVEEDIANVKAIRDTVGDRLRLGIDANGTWDYFDALHALRKMEKYDILMCEQPVPWREIDNLARLRQKVGIPICADESATELAHVLRLIERDAVDALFIKLAKVGGMVQAQKWVAIAKAAGLPVMCGCMVGTGLETAWQAHFIAASEWMGHIEQENLGVLIIHDQLETVKEPITDDLVREIPRVENGIMYAPGGPGLGVTLNDELVEKFRTRGKPAVVIGG
ncbi:MAG: mandelate racemase/muconate lactonizing enzyme family protein [Burkholderiales bacterium]|nr:mandelate racemase/muconate lactonizing enzyme family protein [Burkholderiales bacterium]